MSSHKPSENPSTTSFAYDQMISRWEKMDSVLGGTDTMREAGDALLPRHTEESDSSWQERIDTATLLNLTELTLDSWVGRPFSDALVQNEDIPDAVAALLDDVDQQGSSLSVFARGWFRDGLSKAISHVLVDFPHVKINPGDPPRTKEDDRAANLRPYTVFIRPEDVIFAHQELINGKATLTEVRILENITGMNGFEETSMDQIRVLNPGHVRIFVREDPDKEESPWILDDEWDTGLDFIPLVTFYSNRTGFMQGKSPLEDLADLNIRHWQSTSDQIAILTVSRFPILAASGNTDVTQKMVIGPNRWLHIDDPEGKIYYVEHTGKAINAGRQDLLDLEEQMANYGADFLKKRPGSITATARALDAAEATSPLQDAVVRFEDAISSVLDFLAAWLSIPEGGGSVSISTDFGPESLDQNYVTALTEARKSRDLSRVAFLTELKRTGILPDDFDIDADQTALEEEAVAFASIPIDA